MVKYTSILAIVSFVLMGLLAPTSLMAQEQDRQTDQQQQDKWGQLMSAINNVDQEAQELEQANVMSADNVKLVDVSELKAEESRATDQDQRSERATAQNEREQSLEQALDRNTQAISDLRASITETDGVIQQKLDSEGISTQDVIALDVEQDGSVVVYHRSS